MTGLSCPTPRHHQGPCLTVGSSHVAEVFSRACRGIAGQRGPVGGGLLAFGQEIVLSKTPSLEELCADSGQGSPGAWAQAGTLCLFGFF